MSKKYIAKMTGFKATNADMVCKGTNNGKQYSHQYELGKWYEIEGDVELCQRGFHFCMSPSGVYSYYNDPSVRVFECEAEQVLECPIEAGADFKLVAKRIRLTKEITPGYRGTDKKNDGDLNTGNRNTGDLNTGDLNTGNRNTGNRNTGDLNTGNRNTGNRNTGDRNTGDRNTGNRNTGDLNTGDWNTGDLNTGDRNTGNRNTGNLNTGDWNTGDLNTGDRNTGDRNTGNLNTGDWNTGDRNTGDLNTGDWNTGDLNTGDRNTGNRNTGNLNTGDWNTGDLNTGDRNTGNRNTGNLNTGNWNTGDRHSGFFCVEEPKMLSFDVQTDLTFDAFLAKYPEAYELGGLLTEPEKISFDRFKNIPGITEKKLAALHKKHLAAKKS